ncbi:class I SAM-dependent methyltransferase [Aureivirga sp. CE67]|uniref:class I SAM-dependent methyltransferase n=1 Tax=Aureivirga sp. CE67 TaxID=1788983 RepID=UPI0018C992CC|nr:class I SAM-dependent methyltransferase [Aureivirga sp. CE67]
MNKEENYLEINKNSWNQKTKFHLKSEFYDVPSFLKGKSSLNQTELDLLGNVKGKKILHLQCHFGQDSISLARMGAEVTAIDLSDKAIEAGKDLAKQTNTEVRFICCDVYDLPNHLDEKFDIIYTSYGTIGWLPDLDKWAKVISHFLKPNGEFVFVEFHPVVWMFDDDFKGVNYPYSSKEAIIESYEGTYADKNADLDAEYVMWNHGIDVVLSSLLQNDLELKSFEEFNYSHYDCFRHTVEFEPNKYRIEKFGDKIPMMYSIKAIKKA